MSPDVRDIQFIPGIAILRRLLQLGKVIQMNQLDAAMIY